jgi:Uma2 family endonuclease
MAETDVHRDQMIELLNCLKAYFRADPQVYVTGNIFLYYLDEAGERQSVSPDIFVVRGVEKKERRIYKLEAEGKGPDMVIELTSLSTKVEDLGNKKVIYANMGVREYFIFDPLSEWMPSQLRGFRLKGSEYLPMTGRRLRSHVLGLELALEEGRLRLYDSKTRQRLLTYEEVESARQAAEAKAHAEAAARQTAEAKAHAEAAARQTAEAELARLREELAQLQKQKSGVKKSGRR